MSSDYQNPGPTRDEVEALEGPVLLEFGTPWCGFCRAAAPLAESAVRGYPTVQRIKVEDGSGRPLGRSFRVKAWPTFVFLKDGHEVARSVRPHSEEELREGLEAIAKL